MGPGAHSPHKEFGKDVKHKMHFGGKYKWKPDSNPPPGLYEPNPNAIKNIGPSHSIAGKSKRTDFTKIPMQENPSGTLYSAPTDFGKGLKN